MQAPHKPSIDAFPQGEVLRFNPLDYRLIFHRPKLISSQSTWVGHIPFAFVLIEMLRPNLLVELGVFAGDSYCAFCQAVAELGLPTQCVGVDTWVGDPQNGFYTEQIFQQLLTHHDPLYSQFSRFFRGEFDHAAASFGDRQIDLLHIDGLHSYEAVKHDFETWLPKLSDGAVVLFHDTQILDRGFGVHQFWREVAARYPHFEFHHGCGLGVIAVGSKIPDAFSHFLESAEKHPKQVRDLFSELGFRFETANEHTRLAIEIWRACAALDAWDEATGRPKPPQTDSGSLSSAVRLRERIRAIIDDDLNRRGINQPGPNSKPST
jgi:hypothetical protein